MSASFITIIKRLLTARSVRLLAGLLIAIGTCLILTAGSPEEVPLSERQTQILAGEPNRLFYSARRWEELHHWHPLKLLPRYIGVAIVGYGLRLSPTAYSQTVARHIPFRVSNLNQDCDCGIFAAAAQIFHKPLNLISDAELSRLMERSVAPARFPAANTTDAQPEH